MKRSWIFGYFIAFVFWFSSAFIAGGESAYDLPGSSEETKPFVEDSISVKAKSILDSLTLDQKIGQLFMISAQTSLYKDVKLEKLIEEYHIGGLIFFKGHPYDQYQLTRKYQSLASIPLLIGIDGEWGLSMRLDSVPYYPHQMMLGAQSSAKNTYEMGKQIAQQCKAMGIHVNFAPVVDVNNNPKNPVINSRSFGEVTNQVVQQGLAYSNGMQDNGVMACAKHFPGHGDTDTDSHKGLPQISHSRERFDSIELVPFKKLFQSGVGSVMIAHLFLPKLDTTQNLPSTLSYKISTELLRDQLGFKGLAFTDAMNMKGVANYADPGEVDLMAFKAGADILLYSQNIPRAIKVFKEAVTKGTLSEERINQSVLRILEAKVKYGCYNELPEFSGSQLHQKLFQENVDSLNAEIARQSVTVLNDTTPILPLVDIYDSETKVITVGKSGALKATIELYEKASYLHLPESPSEDQIKRAMRFVKGAKRIILSIHQVSLYPSKGYKFSSQAKKLTRVLSGSDCKQKIFMYFGNPYALQRERYIEKFSAILLGYEDTKYTQVAVPTALYGGSDGQGVLPVSFGTFKAGKADFFLGLNRLKRASPLELNANLAYWDKIDSTIKDAIKQKAMPGCQIVAVKNGNVFIDTAYGDFSYTGKKKVDKGDLYDIASITKIMATTLSLMRLESQGVFSSDSTLGFYLPELLDSTVYADLVINDVLSHQARLVSWIPFYLKTLEEGKLNEKLYSTKRKGVYTTSVARDLYIDSNYKDSIYTTILATDLRSRSGYKYSDVGYYFLWLIIEKLAGMPMEEYVYKTFYRPLQLTHITYLPRQKYSEDVIVPSAHDKVFRNRVLQGYVHDQGAAMLGGVAGHAGLFSNGESLAVLAQMIMNGGSYGGRKLVKAEVVKKYTSCFNCPKNRRGLGFDKQPVEGEGGSSSDLVSKSSYGHSGFTGTLFWVDPTNELIYVFLSNRTFPDDENKKLLQMDVRTKIHTYLYLMFS